MFTHFFPAGPYESLFYDYYLYMAGYPIRDLPFEGISPDPREGILWILRVEAVNL